MVLKAFPLEETDWEINSLLFLIKLLFNKISLIWNHIHME